MACLEEVRDAQISIDMELSPIEDSYAFLHKCGVNVAKEEVERVDSLRYSFKRLLSQAVSEYCMYTITSSFSLPRVRYSWNWLRYSLSLRLTYWRV